MKAVDTTAAGDIFNGTLAVALAEGKSLLDAARFASAAAAISVTRFGAQTSAPSRREIDHLLANRKIARGRAAFTNNHRNGSALGNKALAEKRNGSWSSLSGVSRICRELHDDNA